MVNSSDRHSRPVPWMTDYLPVQWVKKRGKHGHALEIWRQYFTVILNIFSLTKWIWHPTFVRIKSATGIQLIFVKNVNDVHGWIQCFICQNGHTWIDAVIWLSLSVTSRSSLAIPRHWWCLQSEWNGTTGWWGGEREYRVRENREWERRAAKKKTET